MFLHNLLNDKFTANISNILKTHYYVQIHHHLNEFLPRAHACLPGGNSVQLNMIIDLQNVSEIMFSPEAMDTHVVDHDLII